MKATRYFSDYQSAYNYYGGNVVPSTEIALIGDGSYIFVSSDNAVSGNQQYFDVSMTNDEIVDTMTYTAYNNGVSYGETIGYAQGYECGYSYGYSYGYSEGEASGSGTSLTDEQLNALSKSNLAKYISSGEWENYTSGSVNYVPVYDTYGMTIDAEWMKKIIVSINMLTLNGGDCQPVFVEKIVNGIPTHQTITLNSSTDDYLSATISLSTGDKVGFSLVECEADNATGEVIPYYGMWLMDDSQIDQQSGDPIYTHWIEVDDDGDYEAKWTLGTDPESGDSTIEFSFELVPGDEPEGEVCFGCGGTGEVDDGDTCSVCGGTGYLPS
jgi:hypothetical protein